MRTPGVGDPSVMPLEEYPEFQRHEVVESVLGELVTDGVVVWSRWVPSPQCPP